MRQKFSALLGIVGGIVDLVAGFTLLQPSPLMPSSMTQTPMMNPTPNVLLSYFLLALGVLVLLTGVYMLRLPMMQKRSTLGPLMILYGVIMLVLGVGMIGQMFSVMQGSILSGSAMILLGAAMLYSGSTMTGK